MTWVIYGGSRQGAMTEPNQQPKDNSIRQADSVGSEELDAAILAAVERVNEVYGEIFLSASCN